MQTTASVEQHVYINVGRKAKSEPATDKKCVAEKISERQFDFYFSLCVAVFLFFLFFCPPTSVGDKKNLPKEVILPEIIHLCTTGVTPV